MDEQLEKRNKLAADVLRLSRSTSQGRCVVTGVDLESYEYPEMVFQG